MQVPAEVGLPRLCFLEMSALLLQQFEWALGSP